MSNENKTTLLCILDGFGLNPRQEANAVAAAKKPFFDSLWQSCPHSTLITYGPRVGLPEGQMGNSEVGHLNIGAGRMVEQMLVRISRQLREQSFCQAESWRNFVKKNSAAKHIHLFGLVSDGGVHSHIEHLEMLLSYLHANTRSELVVHFISDGRDTPPQSGSTYAARLEKFCMKYERITLSTIIGRFFAMDRDKRWERVKKAYDLFVDASGAKMVQSSCEQAFLGAYANKQTDEFIEPLVINPKPIEAGDAAIFWNFREDRMRQICAALCLDNFDGFDRSSGRVFDRDKVICFCEYDSHFNLPFLFQPAEIRNQIGEIISMRNELQFRCAETEKYPHVTYFLNAGREDPYPGEERCLIPSPRDVRTYDQKPEMSAAGVSAAVKAAIESDKYRLVVVNFANCDMVGHTGNLSAAIKAVEAVDKALSEIIEPLLKHGGQAVIIADHGNAEQMIDYQTGEPYTAHTLFPVPIIVVGASNSLQVRSGGALCDVAPTLLELMNIPKPVEMTGQSLISNR